MNQLSWFGTQLFLLCILNFNLGFSRTGSIDLTFNPNDLGFGFGDGASFTIRATDTLPDGKIMIAGAFTSYNGTSIYRLARLNNDESIDQSFFANVSGSTLSIAEQTALAFDEISLDLIFGVRSSFDGMKPQPINGCFGAVYKKLNTFTCA
jgi:hypothetical protein